MKKIYLSIIFFTIIFSGCGTKREYYEPKNIAGDIIYTNSLPAPIKSLSRDGATLENGQIITKDGLSKVTLEKGFSFVGKYDGKLISADDKGTLRVLNTDGSKFFETTFKQAVAVASIKNNILAVVDSSNTLYLVNTTNNKINFVSKQDEIFALDDRIAAPVFLNSLAVFPTLDGKIIIVDWKKGKKIRDLVISSDPFFNNVIFLSILNDKLIAATATRVLSISAKKTAFLDENVKNLVTYEDKIALMCKDGRIQILNLNLQVLKEKKFLFAVFVDGMSDGTLYAAERNGHLIRTDFNLEDTKVYKLPDEVEAPLFMANDTIFYDDHMTKLYGK